MRGQADLLHGLIQRRTTVHPHFHGFRQYRVANYLICMSLGTRRKMKRLENTHAHMRRTCKLCSERPLADQQATEITIKVEHSNCLLFEQLQLSCCPCFTSLKIGWWFFPFRYIAKMVTIEGENCNLTILSTRSRYSQMPTEAQRKISELSKE